MFTKGFTVCFSALDLLRINEKGIITHFRNNDEATINKIMAMGIIPGFPITLEQHFPYFVVKVGQTRLTIEREIARSIYVRII